jgi:hypothetical protein
MATTVTSNARRLPPAVIPVISILGVVGIVGIV